MRSTIHGGLSLLLVGGLLLRPAQLEAILIHSHGSEGGHMHALTRSDISLYHVQHDRLHEREHVHVHDDDHENFHTGETDHSEECGAILVVFGDMRGGNTSPRIIATANHTAGASQSIVFAMNTNLAILSEAIHRSGCHPPPVAPPLRALDAILQSSHAILI